MEKLFECFTNAMECTGDLSKDLIFKDCPEILWDSLGFLTLVANVEEEFGVILKADDVKSSKTIEDLYNLILTKEKK